MTDGSGRGWKIFGVVAMTVAVVAAIVTAVVLITGRHTMSWGEEISRNEEYVRVDGQTLTQEDLDYLAGMRHLRYLELTNCNVAECRLPELTFASESLNSLDLSGTEGLWDLSFLSSLQVDSLDLTGCPKVDDISMLNWDVLYELSIDETDVTDLSPAAGSRLNRISFAHTNVSDLTPLANVDGLWSVNGSYTQVSSLDALAGMRNAWLLCFDGCHIKEVTTPFAASYIHELSLADTGVRDLSGFAACRELVELDVSGNPRFSDFSWFNRQCCETLQYVNVGQTGCSADDIDWIASCTKLEELTLDGIALDSLDLCAKLGELTVLSALDCGLTDVSGLEACSKLGTILLGYNQITDISRLPEPAENWPVTVLDLSHNRLDSLAQLPKGKYRGLLLQGNSAYLGRTIPAGTESYNVVVDWCDGIENGRLGEYILFPCVYLVHCPEDYVRGTGNRRRWHMQPVADDELLQLLEDDELGFSLFVDFGPYAECVRSHDANLAEAS